MEPLFQIPEDFAALSDEELLAFIESAKNAIDAVVDDPTSYVNEDRSSAALLDEMAAGVEALEAAKAEVKVRTETVEEEIPEVDAEALAAEIAELATRAHAEDENDDVVAEEGEPLIVAEVEEPIAAEVEEPITASVEAPEPVLVDTPPTAELKPLPPPARSRRAMPQPEQRKLALTAAAGASDLPLGYEFDNELEIASAMIHRRNQFGNIPEGVSGEKNAIARADWRGEYPADRTLDGSYADTALIAAAVDEKAIKREMKRRRQNALTASGGLCAPVTPYYQLQMIAVADRPVRAALPSFNADRGGLKYARPAGISSITTGVGTMTAANDAVGGTTATKTCQVIACPPFTETDVEIIYHCIQFGNLGARTFPERVAQSNSLVLAQHARTAESLLLTGIDTASTQVTAGGLGLGASATLFSQILAAANGLRNRQRMDSEAVLRLMMPDWAIDLIISDVIRTQFQRFDTDEARVTALLRSFDIEPTFYIDGASGRSQVFGAQAAGALLSFPATVTWYLYPEGSFLYLDGGVLELGIVRDSVLNKTNDFQIFGESFENVAFIGVESLAVVSTTCDSGTVSLPTDIACPVSY